jgi:hypothetical protein
MGSYLYTYSIYLFYKIYYDREYEIDLEINFPEEVAAFVCA